MAGTVLTAMALPDVARLWPSLVPEVSVHGIAGASGRERPLSGRVDALAVRDGRVLAALDWKSDVDPSPSVLRIHAGQLWHYLAVTDAPRGALVYLSSGQVRWVERAGDGSP